MGLGGSKKCKPIPAPPRGAGLKSCPIPSPSPLRGGENPHGAKRGGAGQAGRGKIAIPTQGKDKNQDKGKGQASDTAVSQSKQVANPEAPKTKA